MKEKGFTLAELLVVVAIIAVLIAVSIPVFAGQMEKTREAADMANIRSEYAKIAAEAISGDAPEPVTLTLLQSREGWATEEAETYLASLSGNNLSGSPVDGENTVTLTWLDSVQNIMISFNGGGTVIDGANGPTGIIVSGSVDRGSRKYVGSSGDTKTVATGMAAFIYDTIQDKLGGDAGKVRYKGSYNGGGDKGAELATDFRIFEPGSMLDNYLDWNFKAGTWAESLEGTDLTPETFTQAGCGKDTLIFLDLKTNLPIAVTYFRDGTSDSDYMITFLDENGDPAETRDLGKSTGMKYAFPYHKEYTLEHFSEDTPPATMYGND